MDPLKTLAYFESRSESIIELIRAIVEIESPSHDPGGSRAVADWIEREAHATVGDVTVERTAVDDGEHLVLRAFEDDGKPVLLLGHTDTVHPVGTREKNPTRIEGDRFYGCGIFDMKSGIVLMLEALGYFAATGTRPARPIVIALSCDEEVGSYSGRPLIEREARNAEYCLIFEPSKDGMVKTGRKGTGMYTLRARGVPAHAGLEPEKGANAVAELARQIEGIHALANPEIGTTVNVTTFHGGTTLNVIPEHAVCEIDVRFSRPDEAVRVDAGLKGLTSTDARVSLEIDGGANRPPMVRTEAVGALYEKAKRLGATFNYDLGETQVGGGSDGNFVAALGVPVLDGLGVRGDGAHRLDEHILVSDIPKRAALAALLLAEHAQP